MDTSSALLIGIFSACGTWLLLRRGLFRILLGLALLAQAANLLVFTAAGLGRGDTAIIAKDATSLPADHPDPLAQALVLTAIVISFGALAFCLVLLKKTRARTGAAGVNALADTDSGRNPPSSPCP